jgi:hypothetical protein
MEGMRVLVGRWGLPWLLGKIAREDGGFENGEKPGQMAIDIPSRFCENRTGTTKTLKEVLLKC